MKLINTFTNGIKHCKKLVHVFVFAVCICISVYQLIGCFKKLREPPISSSYRFVVNDTLNYPAITICRNPPYKSNVLNYYNLGFFNSSVEHTSEWQHFPFERATLQEVWDNATYRKDEVIKLYGLHEQQANAEIIQNYYLHHGRCFTFLPRVGAKEPWPNSGWSILLQHTDRKTRLDSLVSKWFDITSKNVNGFHVYIHEVREPWTENIVQTKYIMQYLYVEVGEELEVKINADEFRGTSSKRRPCVDDYSYSQYKCVEQEWWTNISKEAGCTVPWMRNIVGFPHCNKYEPLRILLNRYINFSDAEDHSCNLHSCNVTAYKLQILNRKRIIRPFSQIYVYYTSKMVTVMEEYPGYDANSFLSDIGGSLGFFLGLSVIGAIGFLEKMCGLIVCLAKPKFKKEVKENNEKELEKNMS